MKDGLAEGKELEREVEEEIREMSESGGDKGGRQEEGEEDKEVEESDGENEPLKLKLESLSAGLGDMAFAGLKKVSTCFRFFKLENDDDDDYYDF